MENVLWHLEELWLPIAEREPAAISVLRLPPSQPAPTSPDATAETSRATTLVQSVAKAAVEALTGYRPLQQLTRWLDPAAVNGLLSAMRHGAWQGATVASVHANQFGDDAIEGVAQVSTSERRLAIAIRLDHRQGRWTCSHLSVLLPGSHLLTRT